MLSFIFTNSANFIHESYQKLTTQSHWAKNTMFLFWKMTKPLSKLPLIRIVGILELDGNSLTDQIYFTTIVCLSEIARLIWLNYMIKYNYTDRHFEHYLYHHLLFLREGRKAYKLITRTKLCLGNKKGTTQTWTHCLILWYLLACITPRGWKVSRRNTEEIYPPPHIASMPSVVNVL